MMTREEIKLIALNIVGKPLGDGALAASDWLSEEAADDLCLAIEDAITAALPAQEWQDISTAPKDGNDILITSGGYGATVRVGFFDVARGDIWSIWPGREQAFPKFWQPLPRPPLAVIAEERGT